MKFYRKVTEEDFEEMANSPYVRELEPFVKKVLDCDFSGDIPRELMKEYRTKTGCGISEVRKRLMPYVRYLQAKRDFEKGKDVYTDY